MKNMQKNDSGIDAVIIKGGNIRKVKVKRPMNFRGRTLAGKIKQEGERKNRCNRRLVRNLKRSIH